MSSKTRRILFVVVLVVVVVLTTTPPIVARTAEPPLLLRPTNAPMLDVADEAAKIGDGIFKILDWLLGSDDADE